jgi:hypothetical protein
MNERLLMAVCDPEFVVAIFAWRDDSRPATARI